MMKQFLQSISAQVGLLFVLLFLIAIVQTDAQNLVTNGDFEAATDLQGWSGYNNQELTDADVNSRVGNVNANDGSLFQVFNVVADETYDFSFDYKWVNNGQPNMNMTVRVRNEADNVSFQDIVLNSVEGTWDAASVAVTVPSGVTQVRILFFKGTGNKPLRIDNVVFEPQATLPCVTPTNINNPSLASQSAYFSWDASPSETNGYHWAVVSAGGNPDTPADIVADGAVATGVTNISVTGLIENTNYDFYVRTKCASSNSSWTTAVNFTPSFQGNLIVNSRFTLNDIDPSFSSWDGFNQDSRIDNINGDFVGYIDNDGTLRQDVNVVPGVEYVISFNYRWLDTGRANGNDISPQIRNPNVGGSAGILQSITLTDNDSDVWYNFYYTYTLPVTENIGQLRIQFFKGVNRNQLHINNVTVLENKDISGEADFTYKNGTWSPSNPSGSALATDDVYIYNGTASITSDLTANNFEISSWADVDISAVLDLSGTLTANGKVDFKNDAIVLGQLKNGNVSGSVFVERYIPGGNRAFRLVTSAVDSDLSIYNNWQERGVAPAGLGTHITGSDTGANGFDLTTTGNESLFTFDNSVVNQSVVSAWTPISNTDVSTLNAGELYRIYVRGDRNIDLTDNDAIATETTLRAKGTLKTGTLTTGTGNIPALSPVASNYSAVANPYQAIIDTETLTYNDVNSNFIYVWDANELENGKFVTVSTDNSVAPDPSSSNANQFIMPGQSFFVKNSSSISGTPSIVFEEADKATSQAQVQIFSEQPDVIPYLNLRLYKESALVNDLAEVDAIGFRFGEQFSNLPSDEDASKLGNPNENLAIINNQSLYYIENRSIPLNNEVLPLFVNGYSDLNYSFKALLGNIPENIQLYLDDSYTGESYLLQDNEVYNFSIDESIAESTAFDRFQVRFDVGSLSAINFDENFHFNIYPNPVENQLKIDMDNFEVITSIELYDQLGKLLMNNENLESLEFDVSQLQSGMYLLKVNTETASYTSKFLKK